MGSKSEIKPENLKVYKRFDIGGSVVAAWFRVSCISEYDTHGNLVSKLRYDYEGDKVVVSRSTHEREYDGNGNEVRHEFNIGSSYYLVKSRYDEKGRIVFEETFLNGEKANDGLWTYGENGELVFHSEIDSSGSFDVFCYRNGKKFLHGRGHLNKGKPFEFQNSSSANDYEGAPDDYCGRMIFDEAGREKMSYNSNGRIIDYTYDDEGIHEHVRNADGRMEQIEYDANWKRKSWTLTRTDGGIDRFEYDGDGNEVYSCFLDKEFEYAAAYEYDLNGQTVRYRHMKRPTIADYKPADGRKWETDIEECYENEYYPDGKTLKRQTAYERINLIN